jgi:hypothetical protein
VPPVLVRARPGVLALAFVAALLTAAQAAADRGVAIDIGRIAIDQPLAPGGSYRLPPLGVRNPGDERTTYRLRVWPIRGAARAPDESWVRLTPERLTLRPNQIRKVEARLVLPPDAPAGDYAALIGPEIVGEASGASVGAAAAARLTFAVEPASTLTGWWNRLKRFFLDHLPWTAVVPGLVLAVLLADRLRRRYSLAVVRRS